MKKKYNLLLLLLALSVGAAWGQSVEEIKADTRTYICGEGRATTVRQADGYALAEITSQISVSIMSETESEESESGAGDEMRSESYINSIVNTYSNATLSNTQMIIIENEPDAHVFRYIKRSDISRIFEAREQKIKSLVEDAASSLKDLKINDALRYLYWSGALTQSLQYPNEMYIYDDEGQRQMANVWIPAQINEILDNLEYRVTEVGDDAVVSFEITYDDEPVSSVDYTYFDGAGWSNIYTAKEGRGIIELRQNQQMDKVQLKTEYSFEGESMVDPEIKEVLEAVAAVPYRKAYLNIELKVQPKEEDDDVTDDEDESQSLTSSVAESEATHSYEYLAEVEGVDDYNATIKSVLSDITSKSYTQSSPYFSEAGAVAYKNLISYGRARVIDAAEPKFYTLDGKVYCRNILMNFAFKTNNREFVESVVFEFDADKKISNITLGLGRQTTEDVFGKVMWPEAARIILMHFLEGYKTAYSLKQIDYVENVFAEDALIITGSYVRAATAAEMSTIKGKYVRYTKQSKSQYIRNLKYVFASNEYINLNFADCDILKAGEGGEIYGIQIKQEYHSASYGDTGYLFLMVDLNDMTRPVIHVRTWQPEKNPNFGVYGLNNF